MRKTTTYFPEVRKPAVRMVVEHRNDYPLHTVERLMRRTELQDIRRGQIVRTTVAIDKSICPLDRVQRQLHADRPNHCGYRTSRTCRPDWAGCVRPP